MTSILLMLSPSWAGPPVASEMHERYALLTDSRDHVIAGDLGSARQAAEALAGVDAPHRVKRRWRAGVQAVRAHAEAAAKAESLLDAAVQIGHAAAACGACHAQERGGPSLLGATEIPEQAWSEGMNMPLHEWALDWLWVGLVAQDDDAWRRGASELDNRPLAFRFEGAPPPGHRPQLEQLVYVLADQALKAAVSERGEIMGKLVATCSECHSQPPAPASPSPVETER